MKTALAETPIVRGIKTVGIGKKGSRPLESELIEEILADLAHDRISAIQRAAFFAALFAKGITPEEKRLEKAFQPGVFNQPYQLARELTIDAPEFVREICAEILSGKTLSRETAYRVGKFLFSDEPGDNARAFFASYLRVRYETPDEYEGLLLAMEETLEKPFCQHVPPGDPIIQLAEPFDGVDQSYLITPLIADYIQTLGYRVVNLVGRNSGPKLVNNLFDLAKALKAQFALSNHDLGQSKPNFGWFIHQGDLSKAIDRWVEIRHQIKKRPFLATLERFINPAKAYIHVASAFHPPYTEKMVTICERAGFPGAIIVRNGIEGTLATYLNRTLKIMCTAKRCNGEYERHEFDFEPQKILGYEIKVDEKVFAPSLEENVRLIRNYKTQGASGNNQFDERVNITCFALKTTIDWLKRNIHT